MGDGILLKSNDGNGNNVDYHISLKAIGVAAGSITAVITLLILLSTLFFKIIPYPYSPEVAAKIDSRFKKLTSADSLIRRENRKDIQEIKRSIREMKQELKSELGKTRDELSGNRVHISRIRTLLDHLMDEQRIQTPEEKKRLWEKWEKELSDKKNG